MADTYDTTQTDTSSRALLQVPQSVDEMLPPKQSSLIGEAASYLRTGPYWLKALPYFEMIAGLRPSQYGSSRIDEVVMTLEVQEDCRNNGYPLLGACKANEALKALRRAYKRLTGIAVRELEAQNRQLRLEAKQAKQIAAQTADDDAV